MNIKIGIGNGIPSKCKSQIEGHDQAIENGHKYVINENMRYPIVRLRTYSDM